MKINWPAFRQGFDDDFTLRPFRRALVEAMRIKSKTLRVPKRESDEWVRRNLKKQETAE